MKRTVLEVTIEHIAREAVEGQGRGLVATGRPEATAIFVPFARAVSEAVLEGVAEQGVDRVVLLPAEGPLGSYPPTDGGDWFEAGVPVVNAISNPVYLLTDDDALRWVDRERLPRMAAAFEQIIRRLDREDRRTLAATSSWPYRLAMKGLRGVAAPGPGRRGASGVRPVLLRRPDAAGRRPSHHRIAVRDSHNMSTFRDEMSCRPCRFGRFSRLFRAKRAMTPLRGWKLLQRRGESV